MPIYDDLKVVAIFTAFAQVNTSSSAMIFMRVARDTPLFGFMEKSHSKVEGILGT